MHDNSEEVMMKKLFIVLVLIGFSTIKATELFNQTNYPAHVKVLYTMKCGSSKQDDNDKQNFTEYSFDLSPFVSVDISGDISGRSTSVFRSKTACAISIYSIKVSINFSDDANTELTRTWDIDNFKDINKPRLKIFSKPLMTVLAKQALWLQSN